jgi:hypothetical protein
VRLDTQLDRYPPCFTDAVNPQYNSPVPPGEGGLD